MDVELLSIIRRFFFRRGSLSPANLASMRYEARQWAFCSSVQFVALQNFERMDGPRIGGPQASKKLVAKINLEFSPVKFGLRAIPAEYAAPIDQWGIEDSLSADHFVVNTRFRYGNAGHCTAV